MKYFFREILIKHFFVDIIHFKGQTRKLIMQQPSQKVEYESLQTQTSQWVA